MANTLLGYFKEGLIKEGCKTTYFNRDFLARYIAAYNERGRNLEQGIINDVFTPDYEYNRVMETKFYLHNSTAFCVFLELFHAYKKATAATDKYFK